MTEDRIKEGLAAAIEKDTPDILGKLMNELDIKDEPKALLSDVIAEEAGVDKSPAVWTSARTRSLRRTVMSAAAVLVFVVTGLTLFNNGRQPMAVVSLDVNPGIELSINNKEKVIEAVPVNEDAVEVLADMDLKGSDINVACNAIVGSMLTRGYLTDMANSMLVSVSADDEVRGSEIEQKLSSRLNVFLENSEVAAAILGQAVGNDESIRTFADENGISIGKAWLIHNLMDTGSTKMKEDDLLKLTTQELILLGQKRNAGGTVSYGDAESKKYIGGDKAVSIALSKAGFDRSEVRDLEYEFDCEDGVIIYEVTFEAGEYEYDCDVNAYDGSIVSFEKEYEGDSAELSGGNVSGSTGGNTDKLSKGESEKSSGSRNGKSSGGGSAKSSAGSKSTAAPAPKSESSKPADKPQAKYDDDDDDDDDYDDDDDDDRKKSQSNKKKDKDDDDDDDDDGDDDDD